MIIKILFKLNNNCNLLIKLMTKVNILNEPKKLLKNNKYY